MLKTMKAVKFLIMAPLILAFLAAVNWMSSPGVWWVQWPALGLAIAWFSSLFRVLRAVVLLGGVAVLAALVWKHYAARREPAFRRA